MFWKQAAATLITIMKGRQRRSTCSSPSRDKEVIYASGTTFDVVTPDGAVGHRDGNYRLLQPAQLALVRVDGDDMPDRGCLPLL